jgi:signal transduction histidine kinase
VLSIVKQRDVQIRRGAQQLESRARELDAFAGRVAHDLRNPLTTIGLSAARLSQRAPEEKRTSEVLRRGVSHMGALIRDLLTLSRIDGESSQAAAQVATVAASLEDELTAGVRDSGGVLRIDVEAANVRLSDTLLHEVLGNLGDNAIKYRRPGVPLVLELRGRDLGHCYELLVIDNGRGMTPDETRRAFEPFFRGEQTRTTPGTGLGLSIVKRVIEASGGAISVESQPGRGSTFVIHLPRADGSGDRPHAGAT